MPKLFEKLKFREVEFRNRVFVSPMCQYSCEDGLANDWHLVHLGSRAVGGAGLVMVEATAVTPEGRISPGDMGIWSDRHAEALRPVARFIESCGAVPAIQLAHAGRKASTAVPWEGSKPLLDGHGAWQTIAPSALPFDAQWHTPQAMSVRQIHETTEAFARAAVRAREAGFKVIELHFAHGYLLNEFLSPLSNARDDDYGGSIDNRMRFPLEVARRARASWPTELPMFVRISAVDWVEGGWTAEDSVILAKHLRALGVDLVDCSTGGSSPHAKIPTGPGYQVEFAEKVRREAGIPTAAVGLITEARQAQEIVESGRADAVFLARAFLRDPYWALHAARELGAEVSLPKQYGRAK